MDKPISVGDLVQIVRADCDGAIRNVLGNVYTVTAIGAEARHCPWCKHHFTAAETATTDRPSKSGVYNHAVPLAWLKRIPPIEELEGEKRDEEITA